MAYVGNERLLSRDAGCSGKLSVPSKRIANALAATPAWKSTVTTTASSSWSYLYLVGLYRLVFSHSAIAIIVAENSAARIRTVTLRMTPSPGIWRM
jgi:hypothetical protein